MRILFLTQSYNTMNFFRKIAEQLMEKGHKVRAIAVKDVPKKKTADPWDYYQADWGAFEWDYIKAYKPDRVIIFNGKFKELYAATSMIRMMYDTFFAEVAWFPQRDYIYIDRDIHDNSQISAHLQFSTDRLLNQSLTDNHRKILKNLKEKYKPNDLGKMYPDKFILVPCQLDYDTSILYASDEFKSMKSLIGFVRNMAPKIFIVVKTHPKDTSVFDRRSDLYDMGVDKITSAADITLNDLAAKASLIVGINSTGLMEAMIHHKHILQLGDNIAHNEVGGCMLDYGHYLAQKLPVLSAYNDAIKGEGVGFNVDKMDRTLLHMWANQIDFRNPPDWASEKIIHNDSGVRSLKDIA